MGSTTGGERLAEDETALIGVDWGTSAFRAYRLSASGRVLESRHTAKGILNVENGAFAETLEAMLENWRKPGLPVILSGMIGSRQGWIEVPYLTLPTTEDDLATALLQHPEDPDVHIVPGLALDNERHAPDVMRGEETQIFGIVQGHDGRRLLVMPGTHSKWVLIEDGEVTWFATFMTGELFAVLKGHSILGRLMSDEAEDHDSEAFARGLRNARQRSGGLLQRLFSARTLPLFDQLPKTGVAPYLSGLLIGTEIEEAMSHLDASADQLSIAVIGSSTLADRYLEALAYAGLEADKAGDDAAALGHHLMAKKAHLISSPPDNTDA